MLSMLFATLLSAAPGQPPALSAEPCEFGETYQLSAVHCTVAYTNNTDKPIRVAAAAVLPTDSMAPATALIAAHAAAYFDVTANVENDRGRTEHVFYAADADAGLKVYTKASGFVLSLLDGPMPQIDFGVIQVGSGAAEQPKSLTLDTREVSGFRLKSVVKAPPYIDCKIGDDGRTLIASFKPNAPWGTIGEYIVISTNATKQPTVSVRIKADVHGEVVPSENPVQLGMMRLGNKNESLITLKNLTGKDFKIGKIDVEHLHATTQVEPCVPAARGCNLLRLAILDTQPLGMVSGRLRIELPEYHRDISLAVGGLLLKRDTVVKDMDEKADKGNPQSAQTTPSTSLDLSKALRSATKRVDSADPPGHGPLLKWSVANEELVYGYLIYRGDSETGPFVRVNDAIIRALNEDDSSEYKWRDASAVSGRTYWYYIGVLKQSGVRQDLTGPQKVVAK
jgi:hypothetical protein